MTVCNVVVCNSVQIEQEELDHEAKMREAARKIREAQMDVRKVACPTHCCLCSSGTKWHSHCLSPLLLGNICIVGLILLQIDLAFLYSSFIYVREGCVSVCVGIFESLFLSGCVFGFCPEKFLQNHSTFSKQIW